MASCIPADSWCLFLGGSLKEMSFSEHACFSLALNCQVQYDCQRHPDKKLAHNRHTPHAHKYPTPTQRMTNQRKKSQTSTHQRNTAQVSVPEMTYELKSRFLSPLQHRPQLPCVCRKQQLFSQVGGRCTPANHDPDLLSRFSPFCTWLARSRCN
jgi:hypothetical protein